MSSSKDKNKSKNNDLTDGLVDNSIFEELDENYINALRAASTNLRLEGLTQVKVIDIKPLGFDKRNDESWKEGDHEGKPSPHWVPCQPVTVKVDGEEKFREYIFRGPETVRHIFGEIKDGKFTNIGYTENGVAETIKVPLNVRPKVSPKKGTQYWYELA